jgi:ribose 1,5-bisphosphate isomerase
MPINKKVRKIAQDIRTLKIQGARRVAQAALNCLLIISKESKASSKSQFYQELLDAAKLLESTRPTEPMMRNALEHTLRFALAWARSHPSSSLPQLRNAIKESGKSLLSEMENSTNLIAKFGAAEIPYGAKVIIHCHSSTLIGVLLEAQRSGKNPHVICLETRPLYQGRLSARELALGGVKATLAVDSAAGSLMSQADLVLVGADAITAEGDLINKIGTFSLAQLAYLHSVRFLCAAQTWKFDPLTGLGHAEPIEQRDWREVWGSGRYAQEKGGPLKKPARLSVLNPAFDRTPARFISAYITEEGLLPPAQVGIVAKAKLNASLG